jgi:hypothetical protein
MRRNKNERRWQLWRRSGAIKRPELLAVPELLIGPSAPQAKDCAISFASDKRVVCTAYNRAIRFLMLQEDMKPLHLDAVVNGDSNSPGKHVWVVQSKKHTANDLQNLIEKIHFEAWVFSPIS